MLRDTEYSMKYEGLYVCRMGCHESRYHVHVRSQNNHTYGLHHSDTRFF